MKADLQADRLVQEIQRQVDSRRQALLDAADREAAEIRARAQEKARRELRRATAELRAAGRQRLQQLEAEIESAARRQAADQAQQALAAAWPQLPAALAARWQDPAARARWVDALATLAATRLAAAGRRLRHPVAWPAGEAGAIGDRLQAELQADPTLAAGLVVEADGAWVDGTPGALLADRARVEAVLRALLETAP
jgi:DNA repair exonuclease SbcCD ATPase subunit